MSSLFFWVMWACLIFMSTAVGQVLLPIKENGKWGYMNEKGELVIAATFDEASMFHNAEFTKVLRNGKIFRINRSGRIINDRDQNIKLFIQRNDTSEVIYLIAENEKYGLITAKTGNPLLESEYDLINFIAPNLFYVIKDERKSIFNIDTHTFYTQAFDNYQYNEKAKNLIFNDSTKFWITDETFHLINTIKATDFKEITNNILFFKNDKSQLITDVRGNILLTDSIRYISKVNEKLLSLKNEDSVFVYSLINNQSTYLPEVDDIANINQKFAKINFKKKTGIIDSLGFVLCPAKYDYVNREDNFLVAYDDDGFHLMDYSGKLINQKPYEFVSNLKQNKAIVRLNNKFGLIGFDGKIILDISYDNILMASDFVKCYKGKTVSIIKFNEDNKIISRENFHNVNIVQTNNFKFENISHNKSTEKYTDKVWRRFPGNNKWGLYSNDRERYIILPQFKNVYQVNDTYTLVESDIKTEAKTPFSKNQLVNAKGLVDVNKGTQILPCSYAQIVTRYIGNSYILARFSDGNYKLSDTNGKTIAANIIWFSNLENFGLRIYVGGKITIAHKDTVRYPVEPLNTYIRRMGFNDNNISSKYAKYIYDLDIVVTLQGGKWYYINPGYKNLIDYDYVGKVNQNAFAVAKNGKFSIMSNWSPLYPFQFDKISEHSLLNNDLFLLSNKNESPGVFDIENQSYQIVDRAKKIYPVKCNRAKVEFEKLPDEYANTFNYVNMDGKLISSIPFNKASDFEYGYAAVKIGRDWAMIDTNGVIKFQKRVGKIATVSENRAFIKQRGRAYLVDEEGNIQNKAEYKKINPFKNGYAIASNNKNKWGIIDEDGKVLIPLKFNTIKPTIHPDLYLVSHQRKYHLYDISQDKSKLKNVMYIPNKGTEIIMLKKRKKSFLVNTEKEVKALPKNMLPYYSNAHITMVKKRELCLMLKTADLEKISGSNRLFKYPGEDIFFSIEKSGHWMINAQGDSINIDGLVPKSHFINGFAIVKNSSGKLNFIDKSGELLLMDFVDDLKPFEGNYTGIKVEKSWGIINKQGIKVIEPFMDDISLTEGKYLTFNKASFQSLVDKSGDMIMENGYEKIDFDQQGFIQFFKAGKVFWTDVSGEEIKLLNGGISAKGE